MNEEEKEAVKYASDLIKLYRMGITLGFTQYDFECLKTLLFIIARQQIILNQADDLTKDIIKLLGKSKGEKDDIIQEL